LLAIRYPHPDGRLDVARVELVIGNARDDLPAQTASWHRRITELFGELTPGVAWGTGIQQAKTLDIKRSELQEMLAQLENSASAPVQPASAFTESSVKPDPHRSVENTLLHIEVNGETTVLDGMRPAQLEALVRHVLHRGKLMTIRSTASELFADRRANPAIRRAVALAPAGLSPLPRVDGAAPMPRIHGSETTP